MAQVRLDRWLAETTGLTRSEAERAIRAGRVTLDGQVVRSVGQHLAAPVQGVALDGQRVEERPRLLVAHKPIGVHSVVGDPWGRADLRSWIGEALAKGFHPVGRLDADTSGLLLLSREGSLTQALLHPKRRVPRVYRATVDRALTPEVQAELAARLTEGVPTAEGVHQATLLRAGPDWLELEVTEGRYRMVRRMLHNAGASVLALHRLRYGPFDLGDLAESACRAALPEELSGLAALGITVPGGPGSAP